VLNVLALKKPIGLHSEVFAMVLENCDRSGVVERYLMVRFCLANDCVVRGSARESNLKEDIVSVG
jgi:hypothetical protein